MSSIPAVASLAVKKPSSLSSSEEEDESAVPPILIAPATVDAGTVERGSAGTE